MKFSESYLGRLRSVVGHDNVLMPGASVLLMPGASVLVLDDQGRVLLTQRAGDGSWCMPGGGAEVGSSFRETARAELLEETGIDASDDDPVPFASISEAELHTLTYPNGDVTHCFTMWFAPVGLDTTKVSISVDEESVDFGFFALDELPDPMAPASLLALELYDVYLATGAFQAR